MLLAARGVLVDGRTWIEGGAVLVERGRVLRVLTSRARIRRHGRRVELGEAVLTAGLVNAHTHLDLGALGRRPRSFPAWIRAVVRARAEDTPSVLVARVGAGAMECLAGGTTAVGDIDATGTTAGIARRLGPRIVVYREVLDAWNPQRTAAALEAVRSPRRPTRLVLPGLSPHAPYTTSAALLAGVARRARPSGLRLAIHWDETPEERDWLEHGRGALAALLPDSPRRSGLTLLEEAGLLRPRTTLIHGNAPRSEELALLARRGVSLVHCPGTHAYFGRPPFPLDRYRRAGIPVALGSDSRASNERLDLRREMRLLRASHPRLAPETVFEMATAGGARALGLAGGRLRPGAPADLVAWRLAGRSRAAVLEELTHAEPPVEHTYVAGREVKSPFQPPTRTPTWGQAPNLP